MEMACKNCKWWDKEKQRPIYTETSPRECSYRSFLLNTFCGEFKPIGDI